MVAETRRKLNLLLADDDESFRLLVRDCLGGPTADLEDACDLRFVKDGKEAVDYILGNGAYADRRRFPSPDVVLLDERMIQMDGSEALQAIKSSETGSAVPVCMLSTSASSSPSSARSWSCPRRSRDQQPAGRVARRDEIRIAGVRHTAGREGGGAVSEPVRARERRHLSTQGEPESPRTRLPRAWCAATRALEERSGSPARSPTTARCLLREFGHPETRVSPMAKNAIELLESDHETVRKLLSDLSETTERAKKTREDLLAKIEKELSVHTKIEEEIFYPAFREAGHDEETVMIHEAREEHRAVDALVLPDLKKTDVGSKEFSGRAKVLKELVEHHADEEEEEMFPKAKELLSKQELRELGERMEARKKELGA